MSPELPRAMGALILRQPFWTRDPDGLLAEDLGVWRRWQAAHAPLYIAFAFNVRLLTVTRQPPDDSPTARAWLDSLAKRADAIGFKNDGTADLIEINRDPGPTALGQLLTYQALWRRQYAEPLTALILVAETIDPDLGPALADHSILVHLA